MGRYPFAPDGDSVAVDEAAIRRGVAEAMAATVTSQADGARFNNEFGSDVSDGHAPVGSPGDIGSDPDAYSDEADSNG